MPLSPGVFDGIRLLELGSGAAGPLATRYFAEQGATVVRIESNRYPDFLRMLRLTRAEDVAALNQSPLFVLLNPDKQSVALDLSAPEGLALAKRLVEWADVVCENFAPGVMERRGLGWETLQEVKPDLIMVSSCLLGQTGPQRNYPGFGGQGSAIAGFNHLTGFPEAEPHGPYGTITDTLSPRFTALLIAAALLERKRTGEGQYLDVSQIEVGVYALSELIVRQSALGRGAGRRGNGSEHAAPHNVYPTAGDDRWLAIAVHSDPEWERLRGAMGDPAWARVPELGRLAGRQARESELDRGIAEWTRPRDGYELMRQLQEADIEAGVVQDCDDLLGDPQLAHRGHFQSLEHPGLGDLPFDRAGFRLSDHPGRFERSAPDLGEHTADVMGEILGLSPDEIADLLARGVLR